MLNFWSLGVELQFYLVFPLIVLLHRRKPSLALLVAIGSLVLFLLLSEVSPKTAFFQAPARIWEFMAGFYVTKLRLPNLPVGMGEAALLALVALIVAPSALRVDAMVLPLLTTALSALFIASGLTPGMETVALARLLKLLGKYSYSIYLVHFPVIVFLAYKPFGATSLALDGPSEYAAAILLTGVLSFTLFHLVEKPLRTCRTRRFVVGTVVAGAAVSSATAAMAAPLNSAGLPPRELLAVSAWFDRLPYRCPKLDRILHPFEQSCLIAGDHGPGWLLVGDSHADVMKAVLGEEVKRVGGRLRLMVPNAAIGRGLTPHEVLDEARAWNLDHIVIHSTTAHMNVEAIQALAAKAAREQIVVAVIAPVPSPGYNVPKRILTSLEDGRTPEPERTLARYSARHKRLLDELGEIPGTRVFRPAEFLCRPLCAIETNVGVPLYSDGGHLSQTGVEALRPMLRRMVSVG
jgi:hypothetical protein